MFWRVGSISFMMTGLILVLLGMSAFDEVMPRGWGFLWHYGFALMFSGIALLIGEYRHKKRQDRLRLLLRDRPSSE